VVLIVWGAVDYLAGGYFVTLMEKYNISPKESHDMFVDSIHRYLLWGTACAVVLSSIISYVLMKRILKPLVRMTAITRRIAAGDFSAEIPVSARDEIGQLALAFNRMTESLRHMEALRKTMIVDVAHEFKTPLTNIRGYLEALMDDVVPRSRETFQLLQAESDRLSRLVSDVLELARAGGARISLDVLEIRLREAVDHVYEMFRLPLAEKDIAVNREGIPTGCRVHADPHKLAQVLHNLFQNALQYTPSGGHVRIFAHPSARDVRVAFANTVGERPEADLSLLFERFYRGEKSRSREFGGAGIGLAVVKDLVEAHNGMVGARIEGEEFQIWFSLPRVR
jgi:signal transduction histidine kinase